MKKFPQRKQKRKPPKGGERRTSMKAAEFFLSCTGLFYGMWTGNLAVCVICGLNAYVPYKRMMKELEVQA